MVDPSLPHGLPWDPDDDALEASLARTRDRRARAARAMVLVLVVPLAAQLVLVWFGAASRWGIIVVALPAMVAGILLRGRARR